MSISSGTASCLRCNVALMASGWLQGNSRNREQYMREPGDTQPAGGDCPHLGQSYNPLEEPQLDNPYPFYARARSEEPVFFSERLQAWVVTRYDDVRSILLRPDIFSSKDTFRPIVTWVPEVFQVLARSDAATVPIFINTDGREHMPFRA